MSRWQQTAVLSRFFVVVSHRICLLTYSIDGIDSGGNRFYRCRIARETSWVIVLWGSLTAILMCLEKEEGQYKMGIGELEASYGGCHGETCMLHHTAQFECKYQWEHIILLDLCCFWSINALSIFSVQRKITNSFLGISNKWVCVINSLNINSWEYVRRFQTLDHKVEIRPVII